MFHLLLRRVALRSFTVVLTCLPLIQGYVARAQERALATAQIPFDFNAGSTHLSAGSYRIARLNDSMVRLTNDSTQAAGTLMVYHSDKRAIGDHGKLVFHDCGGHYYLSSVVLVGNSPSFEVVKSRAEKESMRLAARQPDSASTIQVAFSNGVPR